MKEENIGERGGEWGRGEWAASGRVAVTGPLQKWTHKLRPEECEQSPAKERSRRKKLLGQGHSGRDELGKVKEIAGAWVGRASGWRERGDDGRYV